MAVRLIEILFSFSYHSPIRLSRTSLGPVVRVSILRWDLLMVQLLGSVFSRNKCGMNAGMFWGTIAKILG